MQLNPSKTSSVLLLATIFLLYSQGCQPAQEPLEKFWKDEIRKTERAFSEMSKNEGIRKAFITFADSGAVLKRSRKLVIGKSAIEEFYSNQKPNDDGSESTLTWEPEFVDVSSSGDLGYTYGYYKFVTVDSTGATTENKGIFHTVWKRQKDGSWKFVWD